MRSSDRRHPLRDPRPPTYDDRFRWWEGWDASDLFRCIIFIGPGVILLLYIIGNIIDMIVGG